jgi:hypothetical protein
MVQLHGLASRPDLNGKAGIIDLPQRGSRYPVRLLASGTDGWPDTPLSIKPACLRLHPSPALAVQEEQGAARRIRREARALTRRQNRRLDRGCEGGQVRLTPAMLQAPLSVPPLPPRSLVRGSLCLVRGVDGGPSGGFAEIIGRSKEFPEFGCKLVKPRYGG